MAGIVTLFPTKNTSIKDLKEDQVFLPAVTFPTRADFGSFLHGTALKDTPQYNLVVVVVCLAAITFRPVSSWQMYGTSGILEVSSCSPSCCLPCGPKETVHILEIGCSRNLALNLSPAESVSSVKCTSTQWLLWDVVPAAVLTRTFKKTHESILIHMAVD